MGLQEFGRGSHPSKSRKVGYAPCLCWWVVLFSGEMVVGKNGNREGVVESEKMEGEVPKKKEGCEKK